MMRQAIQKKIALTQKPAPSLMPAGGTESESEMSVSSSGTADLNQLTLPEMSEAKAQLDAKIQLVPVCIVCTPISSALCVFIHAMVFMYTQNTPRCAVS